MKLTTNKYKTMQLTGLIILILLNKLLNLVVLISHSVSIIPSYTALDTINVPLNV